MVVHLEFQSQGKEGIFYLVWTGSDCLPVWPKLCEMALKFSPTLDLWLTVLCIKSVLVIPLQHEFDTKVTTCYNVTLTEWHHELFLSPN